MKKSVTSSLLTLAVLMLPITGVQAQNMDSSSKPTHIPYQYQLSANVPLDSYVYDDIDKLDGLGYLKEMQTGTKPYTRMQVAKMVLQISQTMGSSHNVPLYVQTMMSTLQQDFKKELAVLQGAAPANGLSLRQWQLGEEFYHGSVLPETGTKATYQPLNVNNNGYRYASGSNEIMTMTLDGKIGDRFFMEITPRFSYDNSQKSDLEIDSGYLKTNINNLSIQIGKDATKWGQGSQGNLMFSNNSEPQTSIRLSNIEPIQTGGFFKFLGKRNTTLSYSVMEDNRGVNDVKYPSFVAWRSNYTPSDNFTFALGHASILGGEGHMLSGSDYYRWILGRNNGSWGGVTDKWNSQAGGDFRWRLPHLNGIQLYAEIYGEDQHRRIIPYPYRLAEIYGIYIPRLTADGSWDATLELHQTDPVWYIHGTYTDGWTFKGNIIGDPIGNYAQSYYGKITHYAADGSRISFNLEQVTMGKGNPSPQKLNSAWVNYQNRIEKDLQLDLSAGVANIDNMDFISGNSARNYRLGAGLTKFY